MVNKQRILIVDDDENIAELVNGIDFYIFVVAQAVKLRMIDIVVGIQIVLGNTPLLHGFPQPVILYQIHRHLFLDFFSLSP